MILHDLNFALRMLRKTPAFSFVVVTVLALGMGANTAIFSVVNQAMLRRLPFADPDRLVMVSEQSPQSGKANVVNPNNFLDWKASNRSFDLLASMVAFQVSINGGGDPEVIDNVAVSDGFFAALGVQPLLGRWFTPQEDTPGNDRVAILSESLWRRRFGGDPHILGRTIQVNTRDFEIVGVMPANFRFPQTRADLWQPLALDPAQVSMGRYLSTVGRLREGVTLAAARADMERIASELRSERPDFNGKWGVQVIGLRQQAIGDLRRPLLVLLGAVGLVLLIASANVANLLLMRAAARRHEMAVRAALGATARRMARQLLLETTLFALLGGAAGLLLGIFLLRVLTVILPDTGDYFALKETHLDALVFVFTAAVSGLTGIFLGIAPALRTTGIALNPALHAGGRGIAGHGTLLRRALVVCEVALSVMLLAGAGLLIRSFARLTTVDPGFDAGHVLSMQLATARRFRDDFAMADFTGRVLERVRTLPGVEAAGTSHFLPLGQIIPGTGFWRSDSPKPAPGNQPVTDVLVVMPGYFAAMGIPTLRGRVFDSQDRPGVPDRVVINQTLARRLFPHDDPIGKVLAVEWGKRGQNPGYEIVGVVGDVHQHSIDKPAESEIFLCDLQQPTGPIFLVARTHGSLASLVKAITTEVHSVRGDIPISDVRTMDEYVADSVAAPRFQTTLLAGFAVLALLLAGVGIFGVISQSVAERTREIGIRRALGAEHAGVIRLVLGQGLVLAGIGIAIGEAGALAFTRFLHTLLFGVPPTDPLTFAAVPVFMIATAVAATYWPARRAARIDPMEALRHE